MGREGPVTDHDEECPALRVTTGIEPDHLLQTLQAYFDRRGYRKRIAADLNIHPNTLSYRLDRIAQLLEIELDDPSVQALLHTALRLRQLGQD